MFGDHDWVSPVGGELWRTDGTAAGTRPLGETYTGERADRDRQQRPHDADHRRLVLSSIRTDGSSASPLPTWRSHDAMAVPSGFLTNLYVGAYNTSPVGFELTHLDQDGANPQLLADL